MLLPIVPVIAAAATLGLTPVVQTLGLKWGWVDQPGKRKVHQKPIVRVGGIAIFAGAMAAVLLGCLSGFLPDIPAYSGLQLAGILLGGTGFFLIGLLDDIFHFSPFIRLFLQGLVVCVSWVCGVRVDVLPVPFVGAVSTGLLSLPITFFWLAGVANAINWMDGLDGLAAGVSAIAALVFGLICWQNPPLALVALALAGSLVGFLRYNVNPARIFMGDGGSYFLGFTLAAIAAVGLMQIPLQGSAALPFWVLAVPIADMTRVILSRLWDRKSPFFPDQRHLHHKLLQAHFSVRAAVRLVWSLSAWFGSWVLVVAALPYGPIALVLSSGLLILTSFPLWQARFPALVRSR